MAATSTMASTIRRMAAAIAALLVLASGGATGYYVLGHGRWRFAECLYMAVITISTVGFAELSKMGEVPGARPLTVAIIVCGVGVLAYFQANLTALLVEGVIGQALRRSRMRKSIIAIRDHVVVAGAGSTGKHVIEELISTKTPFVVIERNAEHGQHLSDELMEGKMLIVTGDATEDHVLVEAGVDRAKGVIAALTHDKDNLFVTLSARSLNAAARIVAKVAEHETVPKMMKAGASAVVNPTMIGGRRMASELIRPEVTEFLDLMLRDKDKNLRLEEVNIDATSSFVGVALKDTPIRRETKLLVVAVRAVDRTFVYNPDPDLVLEQGTTLIVMGETDSILKLRKLAQEPARAEGG
jgi:voltage-gated potassium channel